MISIMDDNAISLTFSTSNLSRSATHFKAFCNNNHIWYTSPGLSPSQAPGFGKPSIRAWLTILKAQAHQSQAQARALSPSQARYITTSYYATLSIRHATLQIHHSNPSSCSTCPHSVGGDEGCPSGGIAWRSNCGMPVCQVGVVGR